MNSSDNSKDIERKATSRSYTELRANTKTKAKFKGQRLRMMNGEKNQESEQIRMRPSGSVKI